LLHGHYTPSRPTQQTIHADVAERLLTVKFQAPQPRRGPVERRCAPDTEFQAAGYRVGRCALCGQLAPLRVSYNAGSERPTLVGHPTLDPTQGGA